jgi:hypothetical protein
MVYFHIPAWQLPGRTVETTKNLSLDRLPQGSDLNAGPSSNYGRHLPN